MRDDNFYKEGYEDFYKNNESDLIWWTASVENIGAALFSFDKKIVFNFWEDYPEKLTGEQIKIFQKENPILAELRPLSKTPRQRRED